MVSALLGFMALSGLLGKTNLDRLHASLAPPDEIYAGQTVRAKLNLGNRRRFLPGFLLEAEFGEGKTILPLVAVGDEESVSIPMNFSRRGRHPMPDLWIHSRYPINFFIRSIKIPVEGEVLVFPEPKPGPLPPSEQREQAAEQSLRSAPGHDGDLRSIGDYVGSEPLKAIHWKLSARHEGLKVKQYAALGSRPVVIDLNKLPGGLEERLSSACFQVRELTRQGRPVGFRSGKELIAAGVGQGHKRHILRVLANYAED
ncbi:MAG: hypothetical protein C0616_06225 [Desulfuromonas sp.]|nr:MAG: hypothetical protein C0616_06225 [Desulfuromonas sp.]